LLGLAAGGCKNYYFANERWTAVMAERKPWMPVPPRNDALPPRGQDTTLARQLGRDLIADFAEERLQPWPRSHKTGATRRMAARLMLGQGVDTVLARLRTGTPQGVPGSTGPTNPHGDYDFGEIGLAFLLTAPHFEGRLPDSLQRRIAEVMIAEEGAAPTSRMPGTLGLLHDTENHVLMREVSRQLKWQYLARHRKAPGDSANWAEHTRQLRAILDDYRTTGPYEFNARPYMGYTLNALMILMEGSVQTALRSRARKLLDQYLWAFAHGQLQYRYAGPHRRRLNHARHTKASTHEALMMWRVWHRKDKGIPFTRAQIPHDAGHAIIALLCSYQPAPGVMRALRNQLPPYYLRWGHGPGTSASIYSRGEDWLLAAGGSFRGRLNQVVPQPLTLLTADSVAISDSLLQVPLPAHHLRVNYSGVYGRIAVVDRPFHWPKHRFPALRARNGWQLLELKPAAGLYAALYNTEAFAALVVLPYARAQALERFGDLVEANGRPNHPRGHLRLPKAYRLRYNVNACRSRWVITHINGRATERRMGRWPHWRKQALPLQEAR
jgi:hypothetical protein